VIRKNANPATVTGLAEKQLLYERVNNARLMKESDIPFQIDLVPVQDLRRQVTGFGIETDGHRVCQTETTKPDFSKIFTGCSGDLLVELSLCHLRLLLLSLRKRCPLGAA
tara:strand:+ start:256 stop:585 length:330 start_codon:yes stop_codon:yes gene_type:complete